MLGALAQAAQTQEHLLNGRLTEPTPALEALRHQLYDESSRPTMEEVILYPIAFESFEQNGRARERLEAMLIDCDGRAANDLLTRRQTLDPDSAERPLAQEVLLADSLVLVIDASEPASQIDADFIEFKRFLRLFERGRGQRSEVGGLPVFLVLTKCDLLAQPKDAPVDWIERIEEKKRQVGQRFKDLLARRDDDEESALPFGSIDLHLWATAVKRPALAGAAPKPREPYGVAELFRQCLDHARQYHQRRQQSSRRLLWTVAGALGLLTLLVGLTAVLVSQALRPPESDEQQVRTLQITIDDYKGKEGQTTAERLRGAPAQLRQRVAHLTELRSKPAFSKLPTEQQQYVQDRLQELQDYSTYFEKLQRMQGVRRPADARDEADLRDTEQALDTDLRVPREAWNQTEAARLHQDYLEQISALRRAVDNVTEWYRQRQREGERLATFADRQPAISGSSLDWRSWRTDVERLLALAEKQPFREKDQLPGPGAPTYGETVLLFDRVREARQSWESTRLQLQRLLDLAAALGLAPQPGRPSPLAIPAKPPFTLAEARERLLQLQQAYPRYREELTAASLPEAVVGDIRQAARADYEHLLEPAREVVLRQLQQAGSGEQETPERWDEVRRWLQKDPEELRAWRELALVLHGLIDRQRTDPVAELLDLLGKTTFPLELRELTIEIPDALRVRPAGPLALYYPPLSETRPALSFNITGDKQHDPQRRVTTYTFLAADSRGLLSYQRGKPLWAVLPLKDADGRDWVFTWARSPSEVYQHHRLSRPPRLHRKDQDSPRGELAEGVVLRTRQGPALPQAPDLLPVVRLEKK
jgi:hypothetical protein